MEPSRLARWERLGSGVVALTLALGLGAPAHAAGPVTLAARKSALARG
jgi:hypothetical protein